ncbi:hypothetical protein BEL04_05045 [Mucilaginibacter sp. PPCGB 2223]|uniref:DUF1345 domain-containing protein n=1 Tax=Mucilaginibacter sp. PPCGB 2223 TaxID=1886027 RepID=UPI0008242305|nr:DUF1345 domain-containing protein [Mucilaginibacter sp. PPCGB 2223]OCX53664.1 hypothetical protein BEL04_05045 [Mucilaginibacter sp. PPCGB 2223]
MTKTKETRGPGLLMRLDAHHRLMISLGVTAIVVALLWNKVSVPALIMLSWGSCALMIIILCWAIILTAHPREMRQIARLRDSNRFIVLLFVIVASCVSLFAVLFLLLNHGKDAQHAHVTKHVLMSIGSVVVSWLMLHTVFTMSYAHMYYTLTPEADDPKDAVIGGLQFPEEKNPDYLDFVYFSFVIGMTFQVSDVEISSRAIRRLALLHALISFAFNTAIVALSINVISGLIG